MNRKFRIVSIVSLLCLSLVGVAENLVWDASTSPDVKGYRVTYGPVGGSQTVVGVRTNLIGWTNPVTGGTLTKPGLSNLVLNAGVRYQFMVQSTNASVVSDPSTILFYTPLDSPANPLIIGVGQ